MAGPLALLGTAKAAFGKAAASKAVAVGAKKVAATGLKQKAIGAAKGMAKDKAIDAVRGRRKGRRSKGGPLARVGDKGGQIVPSKGGALVPSSRPTASLVPSKVQMDVSKADVSPQQGKASFEAVLKSINEIAGITGGLKKAFEDTNIIKLKNQKALRKQDEKDRKANREALLESKPQADIGKKEEKSSGKEKKGLLGMIWDFLKNILLGTVVIGLLKLLPTVTKIFKRGTAEMEMLFWGLRGLLGSLPELLGSARKFLGGLLKLGLDTAFKGFSKVGNAIKSGFLFLKTKIVKYVGGIISKAKDIAINFAKGAFNLAGKGINAARKFIGNLPGAKTLQKTFQGAKTAVQATTKAVTRTTTAAITKGKEIVESGRKVASNIATKGKDIATKVTTKGKDIVSKVAKSNIVTKGKDVATKVTTKAKDIAGKVSSKVDKVKKVGGKVSNFVRKLFGGKVAKELAGAPTLTKGMAKASKGIKIPILGPIMVAVSSMLNNDPMDKTLFLAAGAGIGGALGAALANPFTMILGEMVGEFAGELLYEVFRGEGIEGAKKLLKQKWDDLISGGKKIMDWISGGFSRFIESFKEQNKLWPTGTNWLALLNLKKTIPLLGKSFFPPGDKKEEGGAPANFASSSTPSQKADTVSKDDPTQEPAPNIIMTSGGGQGDQSSSMSSGGSGQGAPSLDSGTSVNSYHKQKFLGELYQVG